MSATSINPIADVLIEHALQDPYFDLEGYMERYWVTRPVQHGGVTPHCARVHHILRSDRDRHLHDHPWDCISVVLRVGYWEVVPIDPDQPASDDVAGRIKAIWRGPGSVVRRRAEDRHRLILPAGQTCWSLFLCGEKRRDWGFHVPGAPGDWIIWHEYEQRVLEAA